MNVYENERVVVSGADLVEVKLAGGEEYRIFDNDVIEVITVKSKE